MERCQRNVVLITSAQSNQPPVVSLQWPIFGCLTFFEVVNLLSSCENPDPLIYSVISKKLSKETRP